MLTKRMRKYSYASFLAALAFYDNLMCCIYLIAWINAIIYILNRVVYFRFTSTAVCFFMEYIYDFALNGSMWCVVVISMERFVIVCFPLKGRQICTCKTARILMLVLPVCVSIYCYISNIIHEYRPGFGCFITADERRIDYIQGSLDYIIPGVLILCFNVAIIVMSTRSRGLGSGGGKDDKIRRITVTLVILALVFLAFMAPVGVIAMMITFWPLKMAYLGPVFNTATIVMPINFMVNFYIYVLTGSEIRLALRDLFNLSNSKSECLRKPQ
ncbi:uncharacterized protein LOC141911575 [Tubulanus polymorphus]|uniref:uncharacterized protein LOC141911575 n=1 Tax=Tubulanus polymorphus TaxID=672921 RepID=UPI003DA4CC73